MTFQCPHRTRGSERTVKGVRNGKGEENTTKEQTAS
jgi:hypothetical protein